MSVALETFFFGASNDARLSFVEFADISKQMKKYNEQPKKTPPTTTIFWSNMIRCLGICLAVFVNMFAYVYWIIYTYICEMQINRNKSFYPLINAKNRIPY